MRERCDLLVFRESAGRASYLSSTLLRELGDLLCSAKSMQDGPRVEALTNALVRAGEIESALADLSHLASPAASSLTDVIAQTLISGDADPLLAFARVAAQDLPKSLTVVMPEGFAYYALDPLRYATAARALGAGPAFVVGIRSIGTVLSAVCAAALACERISVRPTGHPYDRELRFTVEQSGAIRRHVESGTRFLVVDEGPGLSGSSFLATAEALAREGVSPEHITLIGSHDCDGRDLVARDATARWRRYKFLAVPPASAPEGARPFRDWDWRREARLDEKDWPATWSQLTPPKYLSQTGDVLWKYEGLGRIGEKARARADALAKAGFSPPLVAAEHGFSGYPYVRGDRCNSADWNAEFTERVAAYLTFRGNEFAATADADALHAMVLHNVRQLLDVDLVGYRLDVVASCVCDARLMPHEWLRTEDGRSLKTDATMHGDDHFFPGPCDIAWDVAGAIVEWRLNPAAEAYFISACERRSGDRFRDRLPQYKIAYAAFRAAFARMAVSAMPGTSEAERFTRACNRYLDVLRREVQPFVWAKQVSA